MSWSAYVDQIKSRGLVAASIIGAKGGIWATSPGGVADAEANAIISALATGKTDQLKVNGKSYIILRNSGDIIYGKQGASGFTVAKANQCIVVGIYDEKIQPGNCNNIIEGMAQYLKDNGF